VWFRRTRNGSCGDLTGIVLREGGFEPAREDGWPEALLPRLAMLAATPGGPALGGEIPVRTPQQAQVLIELLKEFPAWWGNGTRQPVTLAPNRQLNIDWQEQSDGSLKLHPRVDGIGALDRVRVLKGGGLWYLQSDSSQIGMLQGDAVLLGALPRAPSLAPRMIDALRLKREQEPSWAVLPALDPEPAEEDEEVAEDTVDEPELPSVQVMPVLSLRRVRYIRRVRGTPRNERCAVATLSFDYDGVNVAAEGAAVEQVKVGRKKVEIRRDRAAEQRAREALEGLRLVPAELVDFVQPPEETAVGDDDYLLERTRGEMGDAEHWAPLLPRLKSAGFRLDYAEDFPVTLDGSEPPEWKLDITESQDQWFNVSLGIDVAGTHVDLLPILRRLIADPDFPLKAPAREPADAVWQVPIDNRRRVALPLKRLRALIEPLMEWLEDSESDEPLRLRRTDAGLLDDVSQRAGVICSGGDELRDRLARLAARPDETDPAEDFKATLRPYQRQGLAWLNFLGEAGFGGVLADDMGLGKTVQVLAHLLSERDSGRLQNPALIVCPTSLVGNWRSEANRFAPNLKVLALHGPERGEHFEQLADYNIVISTYPLLSRDRDTLVGQPWSVLVLDEAQQIKNARTQSARVVREIKAARRLAMTGTPLENHLGELWAQFDAVEPGLLGSEKRFTRYYRTPIEKKGDGTRRDRLNKRIAPLMLRRRKEEVLTDLPPKTEILQTVDLEGRQRELYETLRLAQHERVKDAVNRRGMGQSGMVVLDALLKLRQVCCDPRLVKLSGAKRIPESAKLDLLMDLLDGLVPEGRRILIFSQFTEMLDLIALRLTAAKYPFLQLTGQSRKRQQIVERFQAGEVPIFLISLKAGGVGLNLTAADTVIHYDPWWNPAAEAQATDRAHRIGQEKSVFVYKLIAAGTVEEKIHALQMRKAELARAVMEGGSSATLNFGEDELEALFEPL